MRRSYGPLAWFLLVLLAGASILLVSELVQRRGFQAMNEDLEAALKDLSSTEKLTLDKRGDVRLASPSDHVWGHFTFAARNWPVEGGCRRIWTLDVTIEDPMELNIFEPIELIVSQQRKLGLLRNELILIPVSNLNPLAWLQQRLEIFLKAHGLNYRVSGSGL